MEHGEQPVEKPVLEHVRPRGPARTQSGPSGRSSSALRRASSCSSPDRTVRTPRTSCQPTVVSGRGAPSCWMCERELQALERRAVEGGGEAVADHGFAPVRTVTGEAGVAKDPPEGRVGPGPARRRWHAPGTKVTGHGGEAFPGDCPLRSLTDDGCLSLDDGVPALGETVGLGPGAVPPAQPMLASATEREPRWWRTPVPPGRPGSAGEPTPAVSTNRSAPSLTRETRPCPQPPPTGVRNPRNGVPAGRTSTRVARHRSVSPLRPVARRRPVVEISDSMGRRPRRRARPRRSTRGPLHARGMPLLGGRWLHERPASRGGCR